MIAARIRLGMLIAAVALSSAVAYAKDESRAKFEDEFKAKLSGDQEVPPVITATSGKFKIDFNRDFTEGEYELTVRSGTRVTQAHFHCAPAGVNGPIVVFLAGFHAPGWDVDGRWVSNAVITNANFVNTTTVCGSTLDALAAAMRAGQVYVNVHSVAHPAGEVRGQVEVD